MTNASSPSFPSNAFQTPAARIGFSEPDPVHERLSAFCCAHEVAPVDYDVLAGHRLHDYEPGQFGDSLAAVEPWFRELMQRNVDRRG